MRMRHEKIERFNNIIQTEKWPIDQIQCIHFILRMVWPENLLTRNLHFWIHRWFSRKPMSPFEPIVLVVLLCTRKKKKRIGVKFIYHITETPVEQCVSIDLTTTTTTTSIRHVCVATDKTTRWMHWMNKVRLCMSIYTMGFFVCAMRTNCMLQTKFKSLMEYSRSEWKEFDMQLLRSPKYRFFIVCIGIVCWMEKKWRAMCSRRDWLDIYGRNIHEKCVAWNVDKKLVLFELKPLC